MLLLMSPLGDTLTAQPKCEIRPGLMRRYGLRPYKFSFSLSGELTPCAAWVKWPVRSHLQRSDYNFVVFAFRCGFIDVRCLKGWYDLCFDGIYPDWFYVEMKNRINDVLYSEAEAVLASLRASNSAFLTEFDCDEFFPVMPLLRPDLNVKMQKIGNGMTARLLCGAITAMLDDIADGRCGFDEFNAYLDDVDGGELEYLLPSSTGALKLRVSVHASFLLRKLHLLNANPVFLRTIVRLLGKFHFLGEQFFCNWFIFCYITENGCDIFNCLADKHVFDFGLLGAIKILKQCHNIMRSTDDSECAFLGLPAGTDSQICMYLHMLCGRYEDPNNIFKKDFDSRKVHGNPKLGYDPTTDRWTRHQFFEDVDACWDKILLKFKSGAHRASNMTMAELTENWSLMATAGSGPSADASFVFKKKTHKLVRGSKAAWLSQINPKDVVGLLRRKKRVFGHVAKKYEPAAIRMLLPAEAEHWLLESMCLFFGEEAVYRQTDEMALGYSTANALVTFSRRLLDTSDRLLVKVNSDYADFNILHEFWHMARVYVKMAKVFFDAVPDVPKKRTLSNAALFAHDTCRFLAASLTTCVVTRGFDNVNHKLVRGLWSGWRSTTFFNTCYNLAYAEASEASFARVHGEKPIMRSEVLGDDMCGVCVSEWHGLMYLAQLDATGLDAQSAKQLLSTDRSEFLRIMYTDGTAKGSLCRGIAALVSADLQSKPVVRGPEQIQRLYSGCTRLMRRGGDDERCHRLFNVLYTSVGRIMFNGIPHTPPASVVKTSCNAGGLGCIWPGTICKYSGLTRYRAPIDWVTEQAARQIPCSGPDLAIKSFKNKCWKSGIRYVPHLDMQTALRAAAIHSALPPELAHIRDRQVSKAVADFYDSNRNKKIRIGKAIDSAHAAHERERLSSCCRSAVAVLRQGCDRQILDVNHTIQAIFSLAFGSATPASRFVTSICKSNRMQPCDLLSRLGGSKASVLIDRLKSVFGSKTANRVLMGLDGVTSAGLDFEVPQLNHLVNAAVYEYCRRYGLHERDAQDAMPLTSLSIDIGAMLCDVLPRKVFKC